MTRTAWMLLGVMTSAYPASAQLIGLKTVPVAAGDQFLLFPSRTLGMGGVSIAIDDPTADPFVNPAKGARVGRARLLTSPSLYGISGDNGGAFSLPVAIFGAGDRLFGGFAAALQQLKGPDRFGGVIFAEPLIAPPPGGTLADRSNNNLYAFGVLGTTLPETRVSLGLSAFVADLNAMDGVDMLYAMSERIDQFGYLADLRAGLTATLPGERTVEAVMLHRRLSMTHDVTYLDWIVVDSTFWDVVPRTRVETNLDRTNTWGLHLGYVQPLADTWRIGGILTANAKSHPKIPNYEIMNIPRDPGTSRAYNIGIGVSHQNGPATFALDVVYEPARSHTWADAVDVIPTAGGGAIAPGEKTVDNRFRFSNAWARVGLGRDVVVPDVGLASFQLGLQVRSYSYALRQHDLVAERLRRQSEEWMEWSPSWGFGLVFEEFELRYVGRMTTGTGRPGVAWGGVARDSFAAAEAADILIAPSGPLTLQDAKVVSHQFSVSVPLR